MTRIALVVSDVDGTLLTKDKTLTDAAKAAARRLHDSGIGFTIVSSRPTIGMDFLIAPLGITLPIGAFNGSSIVDPQMNPVEQHLIPVSAVARSLDIVNRFGVDIWLFTNDQWLTRNGDGEYVPNEKRAIKHDPTIVADFTPHLARACKIVGSGSDPDLLVRCEAAVREALGTQALAVRSQTYYLDITPPGVDKGTFVQAMGQRHRRRQATRHACHRLERGRGIRKSDGHDPAGEYIARWALCADRELFRPLHRRLLA